MTPSLITRLRDGKGADRELDREIWHLTYGEGKRRLLDSCECSSYTSDLNAVFALVARELPGWVADCDATAPDAGIDWRLTAPGNATSNGVKGSYDGESAWDIPAHCRAILLALLAAKGQKP